MRVDFVTTELGVGGAERCLTEIAVALQRSGATVRVICLMEPPPPERRELIERFEREGVRWIALNARSRWQAPAVAHRLYRCFREDRPELVQTFLFHANALALRVAQHARVRVTVGGLRVADPSPWRQRWEGPPLRSATAVTAVSQDVAHWAQIHYRLDPRRLHVIPNGVDPTVYEQVLPQDWGTVGIRPHATVALWVGRLHAQKGVDWWLAALPQLLAADDRLAVVIIGDGPSRPEVQRAIAEAPPGRAAFLGWRSDVPRWMKGAQLLVSTSRYEGMPNAILEAMAAGLPIVATPAEGVSELLAESSGQVVVPFGDTAGLIARISRLVQDPAGRQTIGEANRRRAFQAFPLSATTDRYARLYADLLASTPETP
jgi:starch synthase (maltosyl-transferring)